MLAVFIIISASATLLHGLGFLASSFMGQKLQDALDFGPSCAVILAVCAMAALTFLSRGAARRGYSVFAWTQFPLALTAALVLFYFMFTLHKPLLPFYEQ